MRRGLVAVAAVALLTVTACSGDGDAGDGGDVDQDLARQIEAVPVTPYLPELRDSRPTRVEVDGDTVRIDLDGDPPTWVVVLRPVPDVPESRLCTALGWSPSEGFDCTVADGVVRSTFEEMSSAAVVRGDTLVVADNLVTEADPTLLDEAVAALQGAPEVSAEDLASY